MNMNEAIVSVRGLKKYFPVRKGIFSRVSDYVRAVDDVDLEVRWVLSGRAEAARPRLEKRCSGFLRQRPGRFFSMGRTLPNLTPPGFVLLEGKCR